MVKKGPSVKERWDKPFIQDRIAFLLKHNIDIASLISVLYYTYKTYWENVDSKSVPNRQTIRNELQNLGCPASVARVVQELCRPSKYRRGQDTDKLWEAARVIAMVQENKQKKQLRKV